MLHPYRLGVTRLQSRLSLWVFKGIVLHVFIDAMFLRFVPAWSSKKSASLLKRSFFKDFRRLLHQVSLQGDFHSGKCNRYRAAQLGAFRQLHKLFVADPRDLCFAEQLNG